MVLLAGLPFVPGAAPVTVATQWAKKLGDEEDDAAIATATDSVGDVYVLWRSEIDPDDDPSDLAVQKFTWNSAADSWDGAEFWRWDSLEDDEQTEEPLAFVVANDANGQHGFVVGQGRN